MLFDNEKIKYRKWLTDEDQRKGKIYNEETVVKKKIIKRRKIELINDRTTDKE